jgi:hypothetical protein
VFDPVDDDRIFAVGHSLVGMLFVAFALAVAMADMTFPSAAAFFDDI